MQINGQAKLFQHFDVSLVNFHLQQLQHVSTTSTDEQDIFWKIVDASHSPLLFFRSLCQHHLTGAALAHVSMPSSIFNNLVNTMCTFPLSFHSQSWRSFSFYFPF